MIGCSNPSVAKIMPMTPPWTDMPTVLRASFSEMRSRTADTRSDISPMLSPSGKRTAKFSFLKICQLRAISGQRSLASAMLNFSATPQLPSRKSSSAKIGTFSGCAEVTISAVFKERCKLLEKTASSLMSFNFSAKTRA